MLQVPPHHVPRPRLTGRCGVDGGATVLIEAAAGYGKSVLASELVEVWDAIAIDVVLEEGPLPAQLLAGRLRAAVARAGFAVAAGLMEAAGEDPGAAVDAMLTGLRGEACAIVVDDAHNASRDAAILIARMAEGLSPPGRLVVLARRLPAGLERLRRAEVLHLGADDLMLRDEELLSICRTGFGLAATADDARLLMVATGGWTAAAVLAASRAKRTSQRLSDVTGPGAAAGAGGSPGPVAAMLDEVLVALGGERAAIGRLARLPLLDAGVVAAVTGDAGLLDRAVALGLPLTPAAGQWWELPGPVREHLARIAAPDDEAALRAARYYEQHRALGIALQMLLAAGEAAGAAALLASADPRSVEEVDPLELLGILAQLPARVLDEHPRATFQVVRACGAAGLLAARARLVARLEASVRESDDPELRRAIDAEVAIDQLNTGRAEDGEDLGRRVLASAGAGEAFTKARALTAVGLGLCMRTEPDGRLSEASLGEAAAAFDAAGTIYRQMGHAEWVSGIAAPRALWTELGVGRPLAALAILDDALSASALRPRRVGRLLFHRAQVSAELGRFEEAEYDLSECERIGAQAGDQLLGPFSRWGRMVVSSYRGDADEVARNARLVDSGRGDWWGAVGSEFLAEAADCHDRVGMLGPAQEYLARSLDEPHRVERWIALADCALLARHGDPIVAEERLVIVHCHGILPKERWRVTLLRACAAWRRGDPAAGALAARAFDEADRLGQPDAPLIKERDVATSLLALAIEAGSAPARRLEGRSLPVSLALLGRFELSCGGRVVDVGAGRAAELLKLVAASGGREQVERVIERLWPEVDPTAGRNRLRTVLSRLRADAPESLVRQGDLLALGPEVRCDVIEFAREATQVRALRRAEPVAALAWARSAIARYRGDLLPDDPYAEWADLPRERARATMLDLLDLCAEAAVERGDLDEARRMVQRTIELAPYEDERYLRVAELLSAQGRRGAALSIVSRARSTFESLGVQLPPSLLELRDSLLHARAAG